MPYAGHLPADRTWAQDIKDLFETIQQVKQQHRNREIGQRLMDIIAGGGGQPEIAGELSRKPEGTGGIPGMLDVFNPMTPSRGTSPLETALSSRIMETSMDPLAGLKRERLTADIGLTKARTKALKETEIKPQKIITVYDPNADASYYHVFNPETGEYRNTGKMNKKPEAKWGQIQRAGPDETLPAGTLYQTNEAGEIKPVRWPQEAKPTKMIKLPDENGIVWYHEFNPKTKAYEKTDMMAEGKEPTEIEEMMEQGLSREDATEAYRIKKGLEAGAGRGKTYTIKEINDYLYTVSNQTVKEGGVTKEVPVEPSQSDLLTLRDMLKGTGYKLKETKITIPKVVKWGRDKTQKISKWVIVKDTGQKAPEKSITATNQTTGEKIISYDGGQTWQPLQ